MIDIENLWTSESAVENLCATISEFYDVMCKEETLTVAEIIKLDDKRDFAFICKCGNRHTGHGSIWSIVARTINQSTPSADHPEYEEYFRIRKEFMNEVKHIDVRDYAEPFLKETEEWQYVESALAGQQKQLAAFMKSLCSSKVTPESHADVNIVVGYQCEKHGVIHYITPQQNNLFRARINGSQVDEEFVPFLSKLSQRIVLRDTSAVFREFNENNPQIKTDSIAFKKKQEEKAHRKLVEAQRQTDAAVLRSENATAKKNKKESQAAAKARITQKKKTGKSSAPYDDPNLYILKPSLMSDDWLAEYHICGRKVSYSKASEALIFKHTQTAGEYEVYECSYCSGWHLGRQSKGNNLSRTDLARRGMFWYRRNHRKANAFIHKIMLEEF